MPGRRHFLGGVAGLAAVVLMPAARAANDAFLSVPKHLQVFRTPSRDWPAVVALCRALGIGTVAVAIAPAERRRLLADPAAARRAFRPLAESGLAVRCLIGEGSWARGHRSGDPLPPNLEELLGVHDRLFRFEALLLDVEPHVLPQWKRGERAGLIRATLALFADARAACARRGLALSAAVPPWYARSPDPDDAGSSFLDACLERLDEVLLMAYRNRPDQALAFAAEAVAALERRPVRCWVGLTTQANDAPGSTYHGLGMERFKGDVATLYDRLRAGPAGPGIAGIAIHQYSTLRALAGE
ncbi:MAG: hypothetical protein L6R19_24835 [Alphaproteobacteria bacterium]|nr:hypothetical protein [Alphaproteobacteria bacterium]